MVASTRIYNTPIRQGDVGDELFVVFENYTDFTGKFVTLQIEYPNHTLSPEVYMVITTKQFLLPSNGYFVNGTVYGGAKYVFTDLEWFLKSGVHQVTIRVYEEGEEPGDDPQSIKSTGLFGFNVEKTAFTASPNITLNQYNYLLSELEKRNIIYFDENEPNEDDIFNGMYWYELIL
jgi:hypothetical protein